jgi:hypothetical protein
MQSVILRLLCILLVRIITKRLYFDCVSEFISLHYFISLEGFFNKPSEINLHPSVRSQKGIFDDDDYEHFS